MNKLVEDKNSIIHRHQNYKLQKKTQKKQNTHRKTESILEYAHLHIMSLLGNFIKEC